MRKFRDLSAAAARKDVGKRRAKEPQPKFDSFPAALRTAADAFIESMPDLSQLAASIEGSASDFLNESASLVRKSTNRQHIRAFAFAYYVWIKSGHNSVYQAFVLAAAEKRKKYNARTTSLHLIVENIIAYGEQDEENSQSKRKLYNRDVQAIRNLCSRGISPSEVMELFEKPGEGLDSWSRRAAPEPRNKMKVPNSSHNVEVAMSKIKEAEPAKLPEVVEQDLQIGSKAEDIKVHFVEASEENGDHSISFEGRNISSRTFHFPAEGKWEEEVRAIYVRLLELENSAMDSSKRTGAGDDEIKF